MAEGEGVESECDGAMVHFSGLQVLLYGGRWWGKAAGGCWESKVELPDAQSALVEDCGCACARARRVLGVVRQYGI